MRPVYRGPVPTTTTGRGQQTQLSEEYGYFRKSLVKRLGEYCSFCEVPLGASLAIEHIVSKSIEPQLETNWNNFIFACTNCNSTKGSKLARNNLKNYYFPSDTTINSFQKFTYYLDPTDSLAKIQPAIATDARATASIELTALNRVRNNDPKVSDRRVANRTLAWGVAEELATCLNNYYNAQGAAANNDPNVKMLKEQIKAASIARGFWSVWMTVFGAKTFADNATRDNLLCELFVQTFPGTNYPIGTNCANIVPLNYSDGLPR